MRLHVFWLMLAMWHAGVPLLVCGSNFLRLPLFGTGWTISLVFRGMSVDRRVSCRRRQYHILFGAVVVIAETLHALIF